VLLQVGISNAVLADESKEPCEIFLQSRLRSYKQECSSSFNKADKSTLYAIGRAYDLGFGEAKFKNEIVIWLGKRDAQSAAIWFERAARLGDDGSAFVLAQMYRFGTEGFSKNYEKMIYWYQEAVKLKNARAASELASIYGKGFGSITPLQNDYFQYYWTLVSDAMDGKPDIKWNEELEANLPFQKIIEIQNQVENCLRSEFRKCDPRQ
jgi:TPR repeat protein